MRAGSQRSVFAGKDMRRIRTRLHMLQLRLQWPSIAFEPFGPKTFRENSLQVCDIETLGTKLSEWQLRPDLKQDEPQLP